VSAANVEIIRAQYAAGQRGDLAGMVADFAPDIAWTEMAGFPLAGTYHGTDEIVEKVFAQIPQDWDGFRVNVDELLDAGDTVVAVGSYSATCKATGKSMSPRIVHVWRLRDGKIVGFEQFVDTLEVALALEA
jgi:ketosteroid isomerase-like protein